MDLSVKIGNLILKNPITVASGTAGYGEELSEFIDLSMPGAIFTKGLSLKPREGNKGPRIIETPSGVLNSIGLQNVGLEVFLEKKLPFLLKMGATVIPNIAGHSIAENVEISKAFSQIKEIEAIELNVSCPNVEEGGMSFGADKNTFSRLIKKVRKVTNDVLIVKLSPNVSDILKFAAIARDSGADAISAINTLLGMKIDTNTGQPFFKRKVAGLSGPAIKPVAVRMVYEIFEKIDLPVIGLGGIANIDDVLEFIMAGATAISIGTMNLISPDTAINCLNELKNYMKEKNINNIKELTGIAHIDSR